MTSMILLVCCNVLTVTLALKLFWNGIPDTEAAVGVHSPALWSGMAVALHAKVLLLVRLWTTIGPNVKEDQVSYGHMFLRLLHVHIPCGPCNPGPAEENVDVRPVYGSN